ncbi:MAG: adenylosuccinate synthetase [Candidatus Gracilibacteria bacterium]|jgi:adenylosuccinate synthase
MNQEGHADVIIGTQYGDEGKAKEGDNRANDYDIVARFNGGANAGHTVEHEGVRIALKQVPSGVFYPGKMLYVGSGCMINLKKLADELESLKAINLDVLDRLKISSQAGVIQPHHVLIDGIAGKNVGTTGNGIGPAYADRAMRMWNTSVLNIRIGDLVDSPEEYFKAIKENFKLAASLYNFGNFDFDGELETMKKALDKIGKSVEMDPLFLQGKVQKGQRVLFEGAQSFMLDVNKGSVPFVTSSNTVASAAFVGGDLPAKYHRKTIGVAKAIMSRVGHGPFASEFGGAKSEEYCMSFNPDGSPLYGRAVEGKYDVNSLLASENLFEMGQAVRILSGEYGTVTSRPRRVGGLDLVQLAYAVRANGVDELVLTKTDLLQIYGRSKEGKIPIVTSYDLDGKKIDFVPGTTSAYSRVKPIFEYRDGFSEDISEVREFNKLPQALQSLVKEIEEKVACKIIGVGVGPGRDQYVKVV